MAREAYEDFENNPSLSKEERDDYLGLGDNPNLQKFKRQMNKKVAIKGKKGVKGRMACDTPMEIRVRGTLDEVRSATRKIMTMFDIPKKPTPQTKYLYVSKLECDKSSRVKNYCSNVITTKVYPNSNVGKWKCEIEE